MFIQLHSFADVSSECLECCFVNRIFIYALVPPSPSIKLSFTALDLSIYRGDPSRL
jgi:hypothetical protein